MNPAEKSRKSEFEASMFADVGVFDPFGLGSVTQPEEPSTPAPARSIMSDGETASISILPPPEVNRTSREQRDPLERAYDDDDHDAIVVPSSSQNKAVIPPRLTIKFNVHEEVSSTAIKGSDTEGASDIVVEGKLTAQLQSSDATKNAPFLLIPSTFQGGKIAFRENEEYASESRKRAGPIRSYTVNIPKTVISTVLLGKYTIYEQIRHMPLLLERKVTMNGTKCRVAVQVRSKLSNRGDLHDFTIAVALPERVNIETVEILRGEGYLDELKRTLKWSKAHLQKGESFMVSAHGDMWTVATKEDQETMHFPVLLRCSSRADQISSVEFRATESDENPASMQFSRQQSFRLLHRLK